MADQILMSPDTMRTRAAQIKSQAEDMQKMISAMDRLLKTLEGEWKGDSMIGYEERYGKIKPSFINAKGLLDEMEHKLSGSARIMEETDQNLASQIRR